MCQYPPTYSNPKHEISHSRKHTKPQCYSEQRALEFENCFIKSFTVSTRILPQRNPFQSLLTGITMSGNVQVLTSSLTLPLFLSPYLITKACDPGTSFKSSLLLISTAILLQANLISVIFCLHYCNNILSDL